MFSMLKQTCAPILCVFSGLLASINADQTLAWIALMVGVILGIRSAADRLRDGDKARYRRERDEAWQELDQMRVDAHDLEQQVSTLRRRLMDMGESVSDLDLPRVPATPPEQPKIEGPADGH
jgi:uncharacterized protein YlxW (UPF0749 family)